MKSERKEKRKKAFIEYCQRTLKELEMIILVIVCPHRTHLHSAPVQCDVLNKSEDSVGSCAKKMGKNGVK